MNRINYRILSNSALKVLAILTMFTDHFALLILSNFNWATMPFFTVGSLSVSLYFILRKIGRLSFPIFCFLLTEGYIHTKNPKKYGLSLFLFAIISEIPFDLMLFGEFFNPARQNIYFTLFSGFLLLSALENISTWKKQILAIGIIFIITYLITPDYGFNGVLLAGIMYALRRNKVLQALFSYPVLSGGLSALLAFVPINMYNNQRGFIKSKVLKYAFYSFYPLHITVLIIIRIYML